MQDVSVKSESRKIIDLILIVFSKLSNACTLTLLRAENNSIHPSVLITASTNSGNSHREVDTSSWEWWNWLQSNFRPLLNTVTSCVPMNTWELINTKFQIEPMSVAMCLRSSCEIQWEHQNPFFTWNLATQNQDRLRVLLAVKYVG